MNRGVPEAVSLLPIVVVVLKWEAVLVQDLVVLHKEVLRRVDDDPTVQPRRQRLKERPAQHISKNEGDMGG
jgi:hypothetical protein